MDDTHRHDADNRSQPRLRRRFFGIFSRDRKGAVAVEFAMLAVPFFLMMFATIETFIAFTGEQLLSTATETMARKLRVGEITFGLGRPTDMSVVQFRTAFCNEISLLMPCSPGEIATPGKLFIDVRTVSGFTELPTGIPRVGASADSDLNTSALKFQPGGPATVNSIQVFYRWSVFTDLVRPYVTKLRPAGTSMPRDYLMVATSVFQNENF